MFCQLTSHSDLFVHVQILVWMPAVAVVIIDMGAVFLIIYPTPIQKTHVHRLFWLF
jgi:hypothetical protein